MTAITNFAIRVRNLVVHEFPLFFAAIIAAVNATIVHTPAAYGAAALTAALRFVVSPAFESQALKAKVVDPALVAAVVAAVAARQAPEAPDASAA